MIYAGSTLIGIGLGLLFSALIGWNLGMPSGILIGIGLGMIIHHLHGCQRNK
jgi:hypothetical protein